MNCPNCHMAYNKTRKPLVLSCGHTFCQNCISPNEVSSCLSSGCNNKSKPAINFALFEQLTKQNLKNIDKYIKVCLFGNMDVGKSSILRRLVDNQFQLNTYPTIGIDFKYVDKDIDGKIYRFQIWDSAGQQRYRAVSSNHLKGSDVVLLVYDVTASHDQNGLTYWIGQIQNYAKHSNIIVVGNKIDLLNNSSIVNKQQNRIQKQMKIVKEKSQIIPTQLKQAQAQMQVQQKKILQDKNPLLKSQLNAIQKFQWKHIKISCLSNQNVDKLWEMLINKSKISKGTTNEQRQKSMILNDNNEFPDQQRSTKISNPKLNNEKSKCC